MAFLDCAKAALLCIAHNHAFSFRHSTSCIQSCTEIHGISSPHSSSGRPLKRLMWAAAAAARRPMAPPPGSAPPGCTAASPRPIPVAAASRCPPSPARNTVQPAEDCWQGNQSPAAHLASAQVTNKLRIQQVRAGRGPSAHGLQLLRKRLALSTALPV